MRKILIILLFFFVGITYSQSYMYEKKFSINSVKALSLGNSYVAEAHGFESFEYNPAGLIHESEFTCININFNLIADIFELGDDLTDAYNDSAGASKSSLGISDIVYLLNKDRISSLVAALLKQTSTPADGSYANGLGMSPVIYMGYTGNGIGAGLYMNLDTEVFGNNIPSTSLENVLTTSLLLGYARTFLINSKEIDIGVSVRPMYKIRAGLPLSNLLNVIVEDANNDILENLNYLTGVGIGWDLGIKYHYKDFKFGLVLIDIFGTKITYSRNTYENISNGNFLGGVEVEEQYITPMSAIVGVSYNPYFGDLNNTINPTLSTDFRLIFIDESQVKDYTIQRTLLANLSMGLNLEFFRIVSLRAGLNQGYATVGLGIKVLAIEVNGAIYSRELGERAGDRQQMGAALEFAIKL